MDTVNLVKKLRKNVNEIKSLFFNKIPKWNGDQKHYDKVRWGFEEGDNDGWYRGQAITIHFGSWAGTYGCSSVYKQIDLDGEIFRGHFLKYLNDNKEKIMLSIAYSIELEAKSLVEKATQELSTQMDSIKELEQ